MTVNNNSNLPTVQMEKMDAEGLRNQSKEALVKHILTQKTKDVAVALGESQIFVRRDQRGNARLIHGEVQLHKNKQEIYIVKGNKNRGIPDTTRITAQGYYSLNRIAGISVITPPTIQLPDGSVGPNPYIAQEKDPSSGIEWTKGVWVRKVAVGFAPTGSLVLSDSSLYYDLNIYFLSDVMNKIQWSKDFGKLLPTSAITKEMKATKMVLTYQYGLSFVVNPGHPDFMQLIRTQMERQRFAERIASTIAERNALKKHPLISAAQVTSDGLVANVNVFGYRHDMDKDELMTVVENHDKGHQSPNVQVIKTEETFDNNDIIDAEETVNDDVISTKAAKAKEAGSGFEKEDETPEENTFNIPEKPRVVDQITLLIGAYGAEVVKLAFESVEGGLVWREKEGEEQQKIVDLASAWLENNTGNDVEEF